MTAENFTTRRRGAGRGGASMRPRPMTAENGVAAGAGGGNAAGFNEAAADDRGKRDQTPKAQVLEVLRASMRPRPMTAENMHHGRVTDDVPQASMRPRPMTAENARALLTAPGARA